MGLTLGLQLRAFGCVETRAGKDEAEAEQTMGLVEWDKGGQIPCTAASGKRGFFAAGSINSTLLRTNTQGPGFSYSCGQFCCLAIGELTARCSQHTCLLPFSSEGPMNTCLNTHGVLLSSSLCT